MTLRQAQDEAAETRETEAYFHIVKGGAAYDVIAERFSQTFAHGWTPEHDDNHVDGELALAGACYAEFGSMDDFRRAWVTSRPSHWPFDFTWWKPKDRRRDLVRAAALILAEIERLDRAAAKAEAGR